MVYRLPCGKRHCPHCFPRETGFFVFPNYGSSQKQSNSGGPANLIPGTRATCPAARGSQNGMRVEGSLCPWRIRQPLRYMYFRACLMRVQPNDCPCTAREQGGQRRRLRLRDHGRRPWRDTCHAFFFKVTVLFSGRVVCEFSGRVVCESSGGKVCDRWRGRDRDAARLCRTRRVAGHNEYRPATGPANYL